MNIAKTLVATLLVLLSAAAFAAVDINKANQAELEAIKGIGPSMSAKILDARKTAGAFKDWTDLQSRVKGARRQLGQVLADGLTVNGAAFSATAVADAKTRPAKAAKAEKPNKADGAKK
jgi:competence protein ComEA